MSECTVDSVKMWEGLTSRTQDGGENEVFEDPKKWQKEGGN